MPITLAGQAGTGPEATTAFPSPGPVISYNSTRGNTLVVSGLVESNTALTGISSITDDAGNTWQFATSDNQNPPSVVAHTTYYFCSFIGWVTDAAPVTAVTLEDSTGATDNWLVALSEWASVASADSGVALAGTNANPQGVVGITYPGDLVIGVIDTNAFVPSRLPAGWTGFRDVGSPRVYTGYTTATVPGLYAAQWTVVSDTYTIAVMSFYSTGAVVPPPPSMRAF